MDLSIAVRVSATSCMHRAWWVHVLMCAVDLHTLGLAAEERAFFALIRPIECRDHSIGRVHEVVQHHRHAEVRQVVERTPAVNALLPVPLCLLLLPGSPRPLFC